jgi:glycosyltransferase involved in cell wall biosynthesis
LTSRRSGLPKASIVLLTLNAGPGFAATLDGVYAQKTDSDFEVIVLDSGSTDGTRGLARAHGAAVHDVPGSGFDHGATRDLGLSLAAGEYVALLVQDAVPLDDRWLAAMIEDLEGDPLVAGVYGRQLPRPGSSPLSRVLVTNAPTASHERREQYAGGPERYRTLPPAERRALALFDNVSSCLRRSVWEEIPFGRTGFGEDLRWGAWAMARGYKLVYEPRSAVVHSHERGPTYDLRRHYAEGLLLLDLFGLAPVPSLARLLLNTLLASGHLCRRLLLDERAGWQALPLSIRYAAPSQTGLYLATRRHGLPARLHAFLSRDV